MSNEVPAEPAESSHPATGEAPVPAPPQILPEEAWGSVPKTFWLGLVSTWLAIAFGVVGGPVSVNGRTEAASTGEFVFAALWCVVVAGFVSLVMLELWERTVRGGLTARGILVLLLSFSAVGSLAGSHNELFDGQVVGFAGFLGGLSFVAALACVWLLPRPSLPRAGRMPLGASLLRTKYGQAFALTLMLVGLSLPFSLLRP